MEKNLRTQFVRNTSRPGKVRNFVHQEFIFYIAVLYVRFPFFFLDARLF